MLEYYFMDNKCICKNFFFQFNWKTEQRLLLKQLRTQIIILISCVFENYLNDYTCLKCITVFIFIFG